MPLKNITDSKSSEKSWVLLSGSYLWRILTICYFWADFISSARLITSYFRLISPPTSRPVLETLIWYPLTISEQIAYILIFDLAVISSMKSRIANLALSDNIFRICLLFTKSDLLIAVMIPPSCSVGMKRWFLSSFLGCLKRRIRWLLTKNFKKFCYSGSNRYPLSFLRAHILLI